VCNIHDHKRRWEASHVDHEEEEEEMPSRRQEHEGKEGETRKVMILAPMRAHTKSKVEDNDR
jgi:hypothetical protein